MTRTSSPEQGSVDVASGVARGNLSSPLPRELQLDTHVVPLLQLCHYAALATDSLGKIQWHGSNFPEVAQQLQRATSTWNEPDTERGSELVAAVLWVALDQLRLYRAQEGLD